jgi:hypothetical protein
MGVFDAILVNGEKVGVITVLLLVIAVIIAGQISGYVEIGPSVKEKKTAIKEGVEALAKANTELKKVEQDYMRLQLEKEFLWRQTLQRSNSVRISNRKRKSL